MSVIYVNGNVYLGRGAFAEAFVVKDGLFAYTGTSEGALALRTDGDEVFDLGGRFVCAGFNDSHMHLLSTGLALSRARLDEHTDSLAGMIAYFSDFAREHPNGWLVGRGWNQDNFTDVRRMPDRSDLDRVSRTRPVAAVRCCGHCLVVNTAALEALNITKDTPVPEGGAIGFDETGAPDGRFYDEAMTLVYAAIPEPDFEAIKDMIASASRELSRVGVTSCQSDDYATPWRTVNRAMRELIDEGRLTVRVHEQCNFTDPEELRAFYAAGCVHGSGDDMFSIGPLKMVADGALGARTALLSRDYADAPGTRGLCLLNQNRLNEMIALAQRNGMPVAVHAIGDGCLDMVLDAIEAAREKYPEHGLRHGVVHCQITRPDQLERMARMRMHIYAQTVFLDYDSRIVRDRVGDLADSSYSWKTLMQLGLTVSNGTDSPVERPDALRGIQCAVTRRPLQGGPDYLPEQAFTVEEALDSYTINGAYASYEETRKGMILPGMLADFVMLDASPFDVDPDAIARIRVMGTWLGGRRVYGL
ncbi:MAG: amidohydrolase [Clostridia bacterium]|nr:amidohydrolase [Clostridia bacterium]